EGETSRWKRDAAFGHAIKRVWRRRRVCAAAAELHEQRHAVDGRSMQTRRRRLVGLRDDKRIDRPIARLFVRHKLEALDEQRAKHIAARVGGANGRWREV